MNSEEAKLVFGFEPSGLFEKVILAPATGTPRTLPVEADDVETEVGLTGRSGLLGVAGTSFFGIFGNCIFGIEGNCPATGWLEKAAMAIAAISNKDDLHISISPFVD